MPKNSEEGIGEPLHPENHCKIRLSGLKKVSVQQTFNCSCMLQLFVIKTQRSSDVVEMFDRLGWVATAATAIRTASTDKSSFCGGVDDGYRLLHRVKPPSLKTCTAADSSYSGQK